MQWGLWLLQIAYVTLGFTTNKLVAVIALIIYGISPALTDGVGKAWIAKLSDESHKGRAQGVYQASMNFAVLGAGIWGGAFWAKGPRQPVLIVAAIGALAGAIFFGSRFFRERLTNRD
jgi:predicted MFS family arabinose efflux permease